MEAHAGAPQFDFGKVSVGGVAERLKQVHRYRQSGIIGQINVQRTVSLVEAYPLRVGRPSACPGNLREDLGIAHGSLTHAFPPMLP
jgi:hypothetical protein